MTATRAESFAEPHAELPELTIFRPRVLAAENPTDHHIFLSAFTGVRDLTSTSSGIVVSTPRGEIKVMDPAAFRGHFGVAAPDVAHGAQLETEWCHR